jgi:hypothetical protein
MKTIKLVFSLVVFFTFTNTTFSQVTLSNTPPPRPPHIAVVFSKSDSCEVCKENQDRVMKDIISKLDNKYDEFILNDLSNETTIEKSNTVLKEFNINEFINPKITGVIYFINLDYGKLLATISIKKSSKEIYDQYLISKKE